MARNGQGQWDGRGVSSEQGSAGPGGRTEAEFAAVSITAVQVE